MIFSYSDVDEVVVVVVVTGGDDDDYADDDGSSSSSRQLIVARFEKASPLSLRWTPSRRGVTGGTKQRA